MEIVQMSDMYPEHRFVMSNLEKIISDFVKGKRCVALREAKYEWEDADGEKFEPDVSILCGIRHRKRLCYTDVPRFIAEVLSDSTEADDRGRKMQIYAKVGVQEYWLIDWRVSGGLVERYMLDDTGEHYILHDKISGDLDAALNVISFPQWTFTMADLMEHVGEDEIC